MTVAAVPLRAVPRGGLTVPVKGITFRGDQYPENLWRLRELSRIAATLTEDQWAIRMFRRGEWRDALQVTLERGHIPVRLVREPDNPHDPNAVQVWAPGLGDYGWLGYLPAATHRAPNVAVAAALDRGVPLDAWVHQLRVHPDHLDRPGIDVTVRPSAPQDPR